ncbi:MAG: phosphodiester glycosidase family protein [Armatimonadetes bacterium]|nr:phosphodiester glycosidase family protein [Armatimonadota bacterium]MDE2205025.1 phosphodiester glycosidase family protein [Armatimonadota bacterium]
MTSAAMVCAATPPTSFEVTEAAGVPVRIIRVDLRAPGVRVEVGLAHGFPRGAEPFSSMVARMHPIAAINGAYFSRSTMAPIGDVVEDGVVRCQGMMGTALAIGAGNRALIRRVTPAHAEDWTGFRTVLACGPALVLNGRIDVHPRSEGFGDPHIMGSADRMGVGLLPDGTMLLVNTRRPVTFQQWAQVMLSLGCRSAFNLDAGASLAMYYRGRTIISPGRSLTNLLLVYDDTSAPPPAEHGGAATVHRAGPGDPVAIAGAAGSRDARTGRILLQIVLRCTGTRVAQSLHLTGIRLNATHAEPGQTTSVGPTSIRCSGTVDGGSADSGQRVPLTVDGTFAGGRFVVTATISAP